MAIIPTTRVGFIAVHVMKIGINLATPVYWTTEFPFARALQQSSFSSEEVGSNGLFYREVDGNPSGDHVVRFKGKGSLWFKFGFDGLISESPAIANVPYSPSGGIRIIVEESDETDPIRDIEIFPVKYKDRIDQTTFSDHFLERWAGYHCFRFMDWGRTNSSSLVNWEDRPTPSLYKAMHAGGVAYEYMIDLANTQMVDPWICVPHMATDDYVENLAILVRNSLDPRLTPYFEYSNEVWNWSFPQTNWVYEKYKDDNDLGRTINWIQTYAYRSVQVMKIIKRVFGHRSIVRVIGSQAAYHRTGEWALGLEGSAENHDAIAIAPYFQQDKEITGPIADELLAKYVAIAPSLPRYGELNEEQRTELHKGLIASTLKQLNNPWSDIKEHEEAMEGLYTPDMGDRALENTWIDTGKVEANVSFYKNLADQYGLRLLAYEGGQHFTGHQHKHQWTVLMTGANRRPMMGVKCKEYLDIWKKYNEDVFCWFASCDRWGRHGSWGVYEMFDEPIGSTPKSAALESRIIKQNREYSKMKLVDVQIEWTPSSSLDVVSQRLSYEIDGGAGNSVELTKDISSYTLPEIPEKSTVKVTIESFDGTHYSDPVSQTIEIPDLTKPEPPTGFSLSYIPSEPEPTPTPTPA